MKEKGYYYDDGKYCEIETGPSFEDFPGMAGCKSNTIM